VLDLTLSLLNEEGTLLLLQEHKLVLAQSILFSPLWHFDLVQVALNDATEVALDFACDLRAALHLLSKGKECRQEALLQYLVKL
jgi:hypothetical protein